MFHGTLFQSETVSRGTPIFVKTVYMARKKWTPKTDITPALLKFREKRKWQVNMRRYVLKENPCPFYAPYFGMDIKNIRQWFEYQFTGDLGWSDFGEKWQFDHIVPVTYFDFSKEHELKMCWNFTNIRVEDFQKNKDRGNRLDVLAAKNYFIELYNATKYEPCKLLLKKIDEIELSEFVSTSAQQAFINDRTEYLEMIKGYTAFEFELLNSGRSIEEVEKDISFLKNIGKQSR